jgi:excisionase family DNA binding protein
VDVPSALVMQQNKPIPLLDAKGLAAFLSISQRTLESLILQGNAPPFTRLGRQRRWRQEDVDAWLKAGTSVTQDRLSTVAAALLARSQSPEGPKMTR